jgi:hypothetical protein
MVVALTILPLIGVVSADEQKDQRNLKHLGISFFDKKPYATLEIRRKGANEVFSLCQSLNKKLPSPSPSEQKWLKDEMKNDRWNSIEGSIEAAKQRTKNVSVMCELYSETLGKNGNLIDRKAEAESWIELSKLFLTSTEESLKLVKRKLNVDISDPEMFLFLGHSRHILVGGMLNNAKYAIREIDQKPQK